MSVWTNLFLPFMRWRDRVTPDNLKADLMAGLTGMVLVLPQAVAYAFIAGLPPEYGLYTAMVSATIASLFGSSWHLISGPTAALSIVVLSVISGLGAFSTEQYVGLVISLTLLTGLIQLALGLFRMGSLVNFISHTVVIGFTAGAAILIAVSQLEHLFGVDVPGGLSMAATLQHLFEQAAGLNSVALAAVFAAILLALVVILLPQLTARLPLAVMAGSILLIAWNLIDFGSIRHILSSSRSEAVILLVTLFSTLLVELEFAIYIGVMLSLAIYLRRTSQPRVTLVAPLQEGERRHIRNIQRYALEECPQMKIIRVDGSLFFGAVDHVQQEIRRLTAPGSGVNHILLIGKGINFIDVAGVEMLHQEINRLHMMSGDILFSSLKGTVMDELKRTGAIKLLGEQRFHDTPSSAIAELIPRLDMDRCATCTKRIFRDCPPPVSTFEQPGEGH